MTRDFLKSSLQNASLNIIVQIIFRIITFLLNAYVVRYVSRDAIGVMYVRLLLLESSVLFLTRDAFRKACLTKTVDHNWRKVINLMWLTVPLSIILSLICGYIWLYVLTPPAPSVTQFYKLGVFSVLISCVMEMFSEPLYLVSQAFLFVKLRVVADLMSIFLRTVTFVMLINRAIDPVLAFSVAQVLSIMCYVFCFYIYFKYYMISAKKIDLPFHRIREFLPNYSKNEEQIDFQLLTLVWSFWKQGIMMQLLTDGEKYVMTLLNIFSFAEQGVFDIVNNLGSLAARFLFRPIEESAYFYFSQLIDRNQDIKKQKQGLMDESAVVLQYLLRCVSSLGLIVFVFGQNYATLVLLLYGGKSLASGIGPTLMRTHCGAIFLMAVNGSTECFLMSTINAKDLNKHNNTMVVFSVVYLLMASIFSYALGSSGFIVANCCNMLLRIFHSHKYIKKRYANTKYQPLNGLYPRKLFVTVLVVSYFITLLSEMFLFKKNVILHFCIGASCFLITILTWLFQERELYQFMIKKFHNKKD